MLWRRDSRALWPARKKERWELWQKCVYLAQECIRWWTGPVCRIEGRRSRASTAWHPWLDCTCSGRRTSPAARSWCCNTSRTSYYRNSWSLVWRAWWEWWTFGCPRRWWDSTWDRETERACWAGSRCEWSRSGSAEMSFGCRRRLWVDIRLAAKPVHLLVARSLVQHGRSKFKLPETSR